MLSSQSRPRFNNNNNNNNNNSNNIFNYFKLDIKSPILDNVTKIADVGIAKSKMQSDMTAQQGFTIAWAAPEVVYRRRTTEKIDIWSFGIILWEV